MGKQETSQNNLFVTGFSLEKRVRQDHPLRKILKVIDFDFVYSEVADKYGQNGNVSVPPPTILKFMLLLTFYNVRSERELMETVPERLDWLWFLGFDLNDSIPSHSVLSKARKRWGPEVFQRIFAMVVGQCVEAGMVDSSKIFVDSSLVDADASKDSVLDVTDLQTQLSDQYHQFEKRLAETPCERVIGPEAKSNKRNYSSTDPDAAVVNRGGSKLRYQTHRATDYSGVITATAVTSGDVSEGHLLMDMIEQHSSLTGGEVQTAVADSKYGTKENYLACHDAGIAPHISSMKDGTIKRLKKRGLFSEELFHYDSHRDLYLCPSGQKLRPRTIHKHKKTIEYKAPTKTCARCELRDKCTKSKTGRTIMRHIRQNDLDTARCQAESKESKRDLRLRQHIIEGTFGQTKRYGYKRARWRRLWRVSIQDYLVCTIHNIQKLVCHHERVQITAAKAALRYHGALFNCFLLELGSRPCLTR